MCYHYRNTLDSKDLVQEKKGFKTAHQFFLKIFYVDHFKSIRFITISLMFHVLVFWLWGPAPWPGIKPTPPELKGKVSSTGPPGTPLIKLCLTLWDPLDCCRPGSSVHGIFQTRILEWAVISYSRGSSQPRDQNRITCIGKWVLYHCVTNNLHM